MKWNDISRIRQTIYIVAILMILFLIIFGVPLIINEAYKVGNGYITLWGAEDILSFYGLILSFVGTLILGGITVCLTIVNNNINKRLCDIESARLEKEEKPFIYLQYLKFHNTRKDTDVLEANNIVYKITQNNPRSKDRVKYNEEYATSFHAIEIRIKNVGETVLSEFQLVQVFTDAFSLHISKVSSWNDVFCMEKDEHRSIYLLIHENIISEFMNLKIRNFELKFTTRNRFEQVYEVSLKICGKTSTFGSWIVEDQERSNYEYPISYECVIKKSEK